MLIAFAIIFGIFSLFFIVMCAGSLLFLVMEMSYESEKDIAMLDHINALKG